MLLSESKYVFQIDNGQKSYMQIRLYLYLYIVQYKFNLYISNLLM